MRNLGAIQNFPPPLLCFLSPPRSEWSEWLKNSSSRRRRNYLTTTSSIKLGVNEKEEEKPVVAAVVAGDDEEDEGGDEPAVQEESTATFAPVVHLEEVEIKTHEEEEEIIYKQRAKLFTYGETLLNKGSGVKSWNERGVGEMKLLKHKETGHIRVLMRQEKTMKIVANHFLDPRIKMVPNAGASDKSWVWPAFDFAEAELQETTFAIRFGSPELAQEFKSAFAAGQAEMEKVLAGADSAAGAEEADQAAEAIEALSVKPAEETRPAAAEGEEVTKSE